MIITIDGPIATGKSTIAKKLARDIGFIYFDTGAMYRAFTYGLLKNQIDIDDTDALIEYLKTFQFDMKIYHGDKRYFVDGEDASDAIRGESVTSNVSKVSAIPTVREHLVKIQRDLARGVNAVFEGRDMGTVVFPEAELKIFLTGSAEVRARRRFNELKEKYADQYNNLSYEKILQQINDRDHYDSTRDISPLRQDEDACVIDTTDLSIDEIVLKIQEFKDSLKTKKKP